MSDQSNSSLEELDGMEGSNEEGEETTISISWIKQIKQISNNWMPLFGIKLCAFKLLQGPLHSGLEALRQFWSKVFYPEWRSI